MSLFRPKSGAGRAGKYRGELLNNAMVVSHLRVSVSRKSKGMCLCDVPMARVTMKDHMTESMMTASELSRRGRSDRKVEEGRAGVVPKNINRHQPELERFHKAAPSSEIIVGRRPRAGDYENYDDAFH